MAKKLKRKLREAKNNYRERIEAKMGQNSAKEVWNGMKRMTGFSKSIPRVQGDPEFATELNLFFSRFDTTLALVCPLQESSSNLFNLSMRLMRSQWTAGERSRRTATSDNRYHL